MRVGGRLGDRGLIAAVILLAATPAAASPRLDVTQRHPAKAAVQQQQPRAHRQSTNDTGLEAKLAARLSHATAGRYGMVVDIEGVGRIASLHPGRALRPASTQKLFTTLPLLLTRPDDRLVTTITVATQPVAGVVSGDLVVHAVADPTMTKTGLGRLAHQVATAGITTVTGDLVLDVGSLPTNTRQSGWKSSFVPADIGPLSPFPVSRDWWRRDRSYLAHPTIGNLAEFRTKLQQRGVRVRGKNIVSRNAPTGTVVATRSSAPLSSIISDTLRVSDNFYAESLLAVAGGHQAVNATSTQAGVTDTSSATDGSGLSYTDQETARGEATLLGYAHQSSAADHLLHALPLGCRRGTLKDRFCHTDGAGKVYAKTGTLSHSSALAGYTTDGAGRWVTFSVICGQVRSISAAQHAIDRAVLVLRHYDGG
jgi:D-alanyl-D-alanine carboxypeptidase/D-alanyl-D-alanine-endopeptidase (penicillin-binding protein 4)